MRPTSGSIHRLCRTISTSSSFFLFSNKNKAFELIWFNLFLLSQVEVNVSRDPSRLYKLTAGWEQRKKDGSGASGSGPTLHMPHRYVCTSSVVDVGTFFYLQCFPLCYLVGKDVHDKILTYNRSKLITTDQSLFTKCS